MKTRYKILIVIAATAVIYVAIPGMMSACQSFTDDCLIFRQLMIYTRLALPTVMLGDGTDGILEWSGTVEGIEEPRFDYILQDNVNFIFFVLVVPSLVITGLIIRDRKKK